MAHAIQFAGRIFIEPLPHDVQGRFVGNKNCGTKPTRLVLNVAVHISAPRWIDRVGKRVTEQKVGQLMREVSALTARIMAIIVNDNMLAGIYRQCCG